MLKIILLLLIIISATYAEFINIKPSSSLEEGRINLINKKIELIKSFPQEKQAEEVNKMFNTFISYASDMAIYKKNNYIAIIEETVKSMKGDCDEYVMAKSQALEYLGFKEQYVLYCSLNGVRHVVNIVKINNIYYVLDNANKKFRVLMTSELKAAGNQLYPASIYLIAAKQKLATIK